VTKKRRRLLLASLAAGLVAVGLGLALGVHWKVYGWWRGEEFWRGRPTSFYSRRIRDALPWDGSGAFSYRPLAPAGQRVRSYSPLVGDAFWGRPRPPFCDTGPPDRDARPVLLALAGDPDERVRTWAAYVIGATWDAASAVPVLARLLDDPSPRVRVCSAVRLGQLGPQARDAVPALARRLDDRAKSGPTLTVMAAAADALRAIDPDAARP
jgi:HEAT repeat protein